MLVSGSEPITPVECRVDTTDPAVAVQKFKQDHPTARLEAIDGKFVRGVCHCGTPIMEHDKGHRYDGEYTCAACVRKESADGGQ